MEFSYDINQLFPERVSVLDHSLIAENRKSAGRPEHLSHIAAIIDEIGRASAKAQQLSASITSASKLQTQRHQLYLLKDRESNGGRGVVVGFLKVGTKKLFLLDQQGAHIEAEPLCVLDFYVAEKFQRHGYGLELFNFMLQHKNLEPVQMAYDRPSPKLQSFLAKHYGLTQSVPQVNNFVVFEGFFLDKTAVQLRKTPSKKPDGEIKPYSLKDREAVHQEQRTLPWPFHPPHSPQRLVSSQPSRSHSVGSSPSRVPPKVASVSDPGGNRDQSPQSPFLRNCREGRTSHFSGSKNGLLARRNMYSRHMDSSAVGLLDRETQDVYTTTQTQKKWFSEAARTLVSQLRSSVYTPLDRDMYYSDVSMGYICLGVLERQPSLGCTDKHRSNRNHAAHGRFHPPLLPQLQSPKKDTDLNSFENARTSHVNADVSGETSKVSNGSQHSPGCAALTGDGDVGRSWTVGKNCFTAQWVKQKQQFRSTRPW